MARTLINLVGLGKETQTAVQGIKIFLNRNKDSEVIIIGDIDALLTIKDNKKVIVYDFNKSLDKILDKFNDIGEKDIALAFSLMEDKSLEIKGFVTYGNKVHISSLVRSHYESISPSPIVIATFANYKTHRVTCIGDLGFNLKPNDKDYINEVALMKQYMKTSFKKENPEFKLLVYAKEAPTPLDKLFKNVEGYKGIVEAKDLLKCDTDIVIGHPKEFLGVISGINEGISIYDEYIKDQVKHNVGVRLFGYPGFKGVLANFHLEIDQKLTSGGNIILGYEKNFIIIDPDTIKQGVSVSINLANKLENL